ncbi:MAG TPA: phage portal protein [Candidatus Paceibacterota bacterium]|nr:phage portal protein [Candidatus Paceibacterota bacterium]HRZ92104.1 phage portal protein [Candidatus Paceibacterota bacterium]
MAAIRRVSLPIQAVPLAFVDRDAGDPIEDPEMGSWWQSPVSNAPGKEWVEAAVGWLKLAGEFFLVLDDTWAQPEARPATRSKLVLARPDRMNSAVNSGEVVGWEFTDGAGDQHLLTIDQVVHCRLWNPYSTARGQSEYECARLAVESDWLAGRYARNLAVANGDRGIHIIARTGLTDEQRHQIVAQLREKRAAAQRGEFKPVFLAGDIRIENPSVQAVDAAFLAQRAACRREIFTAFGVPQSFCEVKADYATGAESDRLSLIEDTCKPLGARICSAIGSIASRMAGRPIKAFFDWDDHSVMQSVRRGRFDAAAKLWSAGTPLEVISRQMDLALPEFPGWDRSYLPISVKPARGRGVGRQTTGLNATRTRRERPAASAYHPATQNQNAKGSRRFAQGLRGPSRAFAPREIGSFIEKP